MKRIHVFAVLMCLLNLAPVEKVNGQKHSDSLTIDHAALFLWQPSMLNSWWKGTNPAGQLFTELDRISKVGVQYGQSDQSLRRAQDPQQTSSLDVYTHSFQSIGKARVNGLFGYQNQHYKGLLYNGNMDFRYMNLYMLGDTVGGKQRQEGYYFTSEIAYPFLKDKLFAGLSMDYESAIGAKMKDLRNHNTITRTRIAAGLVYNLRGFSIGLSGGPVIDNNLTQVNARLDERHTLFYHMGMGHYSASGNFSTSESVLYEGRGYHGELQFYKNPGAWSSFHAVSLFHLTTEARVGSTTYRLINGITDFDRISYTGNLRLNRPQSIHLFEISGHLAKIVATEVRQESYSQNIDGVFYTLIRTLRWIEGKHIVDDVSGGVHYQFIRLRPTEGMKYQLSATARAGFYDATHFPAEIYGYYNAGHLFTCLGYNHFFRWKKLQIDPSVSGGFRFVFASDAVFRPFPNYLEKIPEMDYLFFSEDYVHAGFGLNVSTTGLPVKGINRFFMTLKGDGAFFSNADISGHQNLRLMFSLGAIF
jgi:hypothetical protein